MIMFVLTCQDDTEDVITLVIYSNFSRLFCCHSFVQFITDPVLVEKIYCLSQI